MALYRNNQSSGTTNNSPNVNINSILDQSHRSIGRAGFLIVTMIARKRFRAEFSLEAINLLKGAIELLEQLPGASNDRPNNSRM